MRKTLVIAAMTGSMAFAGMALGPASAQAATSSTATTASASSLTSGSWGKVFSGDRKAYTFGRTFKRGGKVYTTWHGVDRRGGKKGWVWFEYYQRGSWHKFSRSWDGRTAGSWNGRGIKKVYTFTCWGGKFHHCGGKHRIY